MTDSDGHLQERDRDRMIHPALRWLQSYVSCPGKFEYQEYWEMNLRVVCRRMLVRDEDV